MNIRIGEGDVRFRVSCEDLKVLLSGKKLEEKLVLAGTPVSLVIEPSGTKLDFIYAPDRIGLKVPQGMLQSLDESGRNKEGISGDTGGTRISLQVDLKSYSRKAS